MNSDCYEFSFDSEGKSSSSNKRWGRGDMQLSKSLPVYLQYHLNKKQ